MTVRPELPGMEQADPLFLHHFHGERVYSLGHYARALGAKNVP